MNILKFLISFSKFTLLLGTLLAYFIIYLTTSVTNTNMQISGLQAFLSPVLFFIAWFFSARKGIEAFFGKEVTLDAFDLKSHLLNLALLFFAIYGSTTNMLAQFNLAPTLLDLGFFFGLGLMAYVMNYYLICLLIQFSDNKS